MWLEKAKEHFRQLTPKARLNESPSPHESILNRLTAERESNMNTLGVLCNSCFFFFFFFLNNCSLKPTGEQSFKPKSKALFWMNGLNLLTSSHIIKGFFFYLFFYFSSIAVFLATEVNSKRIKRITLAPTARQCIPGKPRSVTRVVAPCDERGQEGEQRIKDTAERSASLNIVYSEWFRPFSLRLSGVSSSRVWWSCSSAETNTQSRWSDDTRWLGWCHTAGKDLDTRQASSQSLNETPLAKEPNDNQRTLLDGTLQLGELL